MEDQAIRREGKYTDPPYLPELVPGGFVEIVFLDTDIKEWEYG
jgi:hypothetical protein